jgi:hypothetical protein
MERSRGRIPRSEQPPSLPRGSEGEEIPYLPAAAAKKKENADNWLQLDPEVKCYMPGVPRGHVHALPVPDCPV